MLQSLSSSPCLGFQAGRPGHVVCTSRQHARQAQCMRSPQQRLSCDGVRTQLLCVEGLDQGVQLLLLTFMYCTAYTQQLTSPGLSGRKCLAT